MPDRPHDVSHLTGPELERARRELTASLAVVRPGSPARVPILARLSAIDTELAARTALRGPGATPPASGILPCSCGLGTSDRDGSMATCFQHPGHYQRPVSPLL